MDAFAITIIHLAIWDSTISARHIGGLHHLCILELVRAPGPHMRSFLVVW